MITHMFSSGTVCTILRNLCRTYSGAQISELRIRFADIRWHADIPCRVIVVGPIIGPLSGVGHSRKIINRRLNHELGNMDSTRQTSQKSNRGSDVSRLQDDPSTAFVGTSPRAGRTDIEKLCINLSGVDDSRANPAPAFLPTNADS